jgi:ATP-dependent RNA helicase RhlE
VHLQFLVSALHFMNFSIFGLEDRLLQGIQATAFTNPTPIQERTIPVALSGADILGCAQTGTGKTAAFVIPTLHRLAQAQQSQEHRKGFRPLRALILSPTRELVQQIEEHVRALARFLPLRICTIYGGMSIDNQIRQLKTGMDIIVATPGRLIDLLNRKSLSLSNLEILVLDEADRMLDMGFIHDVRKIVAQTPPQRQTLLFSATMSPQIQSLTRAIQNVPTMIEIGERRKPAESVTQHFYSVPQAGKIDLLLHILKTEAMESVLVFSRTKHGADRIAQRLERDGLKSVAIHSNRTQPQRQRALAGFRAGQFKILVATDVAARGIDVDGISHVINFDIPEAAEDYIHRIGRTGRANTTGDALTFVASDEHHNLRKIERHIGKRLQMKQYPGFEYSQRSEERSAHGQHGTHGRSANTRAEKPRSTQREHGHEHRTLHPPAEHSRYPARTPKPRTTRLDGKHRETAHRSSRVL